MEVGGFWRRTLLMVYWPGITRPSASRFATAVGTWYHWLGADVEETAHQPGRLQLEAEGDSLRSGGRGTALEHGQKGRSSRAGAHLTLAALADGLRELADPPGHGHRRVVLGDEVDGVLAHLVAQPARASRQLD